jgi:hypothetical protein
MLLFDPSPGQIVDRTVILSMKYREAEKAQRDTSALSAEAVRCREALLQYRLKLAVEKLVKLANFEMKLRDLLRVQWGYENDIRSALATLHEVPSYAELKTVVELELARMAGNDLRAQLVQQIDELFELPPEPKFYDQDNSDYLD